MQHTQTPAAERQARHRQGVSTKLDIALAKIVEMQQRLTGIEQRLGGRLDSLVDETTERSQ